LANAYSQLHNYAQDLYTPAFNLIGQVLQYKQGKLDANRIKLQSLNDNLSIVDVAKEEDKQYVTNRLNTARDIANQYAALDLSNDGLTNDLIGKLSTVVDDKMKNAVLSTKIYRSEQQAWAKLKEDSPELYNPGNQRFAMQGANTWLADGEAGTKYNGGGGVIEYDDYHARWRESIPDIAKYLGAEYLVQENGVGIFVDNVTKQEVERSKLSAAMDDILGDKGRQQQMISAWNRYDGADPADIKKEYDSYLAPKMEQADRTIKSLTDLVSKTSDPTLKAQYKNSLDSWKARKNSFNSNSFDALASSGPNGVRTAYQTMFSDQEKENLLYVYSYDERDVKRAVDDNHVKTLDFQEKVRHNLATEANDRSKNKGKKGGLVEYDENGMPTVIVSGQGGVNTESQLSDLTIAQKQQYEGFDDLKSVVGNLSGAELVDIGGQLDGVDFSGDSITVKVRGEDKVIDFLVKNAAGEYVDNGNRAKLMSFQTKSYYDTPYEVAVKKDIKEGVATLQTKLSDEYRANPEFFSEMPVLNKRVVRVGGTDDSPTYATETIADQAEATKYFEGLLVKKNNGTLTKEEQVSLDMQMYNFLISDSETGDQKSRQVYVTMRQDLVPKIGYEAFNEMAGAGGYRGMRSSFQAQRGRKGDPKSVTLSNSTLGYAWEESKNILSDVWSGLGEPINNARYELSDMGSWDSESGGEAVQSTYVEIMRKIDLQREVGSVVSPVEYTLSKEDSRYEAIAAQLKSQTGFEPTGGIRLSAEADPSGASFSGNVNYAFTSGKGTESSPTVEVDSFGDETYEPIEGSILAQYNFPIVSRAQSAYRGEQGGDAIKVNLGSSKIEGETLKRVNRDLSKQGLGLVMHDLNNTMATLNAAESISKERKVQAAVAMKDYLSGGYTFSLESNDVDKHYNMVMSKGGKVLYTHPLDRDFTEESLSNFMMADVHYYKQAVFSSYINSEILGSQVDGVLDNAISGVDDVLNQVIAPN